MKLIRCYIENFGGLQQYTVDFEEGLTVIHEPNGFGKTTLAEFIRAMFYGFPRSTKDISKNLRLKYLPWQGGRYGGYLIFEHNGKRYRIDRSFGDTPKGDQYKLFNEDTHKEVKDYGPDIGLAIFGLDSDSFLRSTYMPQQQDSIPMNTDSIRAKLGNLLEDTGDVGSYEKALQKLKDKRTVYEHYRGSGGSIHEAQKKITALQQEIDLCRSKQPLLEEVSTRLAAAETAHARGEAALQRIRRQLYQTATAEAEAALSREYEALSREKTEAVQALKALQTRYPKGIPSVEELETASRRMTRFAVLQQTVSASSPKTSPLSEAWTACFAAGVPEQEELYRAEQALSRAEALRLETLQLSPSTEEAPAPQKKFHSLFFPMLILGIAAAAAAIALLSVPVFDSHMLIGGICGGLALIAWVTAAIVQNNHSLLYRLQTQISAGSLSPTQRRLIEDNERTAAALEGEVAAFLAPYPLQAETPLRSRLAELTANRILYLHLAEHKALRQKQEAEAAALSDGHRRFCAAYGLTISIDDRHALSLIERDREQLNRLTREVTILKEALSAFIGDHGHKPASALPSSEHDLGKLKTAERELIGKQNTLHAEILRLEQRRRLLRAEVDRIPPLTDELNRLKEQKAADTEARRLLDSTADFLQKARESLSSAYLGNVQTGFAHYLNRLTGEAADRIAVNTDLEVQLERAGSVRTLSHFSAGQTDAVHLCMRLALSDALFEAGSCFMILDDPFVNLDDRHTAQALALMEDLSKDRQIIYLVCNSSRI